MVLYSISWHLQTFDPIRLHKWPRIAAVAVNSVPPFGRLRSYLPDHVMVTVIGTRWMDDRKFRLAFRTTTIPTHLLGFYQIAASAAIEVYLLLATKTSSSEKSLHLLHSRFVIACTPLLTHFEGETLDLA